MAISMTSGNPAMCRSDPSGNAVANLTPAKRNELREHLRATLKPVPDGRIVYEAFVMR
jgi:hypothetical protein